MSKQSKAKYINPYLGGALLGIVLFLAYFFTSAGLGASGAINRVQVAIIDVIAGQHVDRVGSFAELAGGKLNPLDSGAVLMLLGTFLGGMLSGAIHRRLKLETNKGPNISVKTRWLLAFLGGCLMGYGARLARGCTSGQALSGGAVLSVGSWAFMFSVFIGGYALAYFVRKLWNPAA
ncbi:MAG TPA: YeeE/YedE thiosulfate transporter family protein [Candidatus Deferrimicrobium sp.]|nr:YeeE/YedE thiosulfate transporter family protein [Candidatus Deferrimicrobium sp.]